MNGALAAQRIRRVLNQRDRRIVAAGRFLKLALPCGAALLWAVVALDFQDAAIAQTNGVKLSVRGERLGFIADTVVPDPNPLAPEQALELEQRLAADPEDHVTRGKLLRYYWRQKMHEKRYALILWLINHHPESRLHSIFSGSIFPQAGATGGDPAMFEDARNRWLQQVYRHPNNPRVLGNAARAIGQTDLRTMISLLKRARQLEPTFRTQPLARLYSHLLVWSNEIGRKRTRFHDPALAFQVRSELQDSADIGLVGTTARYVVEESSMRALQGTGRWDFGTLRIIGAELVTHAQHLEPGNRDWSDLMEGVRHLP